MHRRSVLASLICAALIGFPAPASGSPTKERSDATERLTQITERIAEIDKAEASLRVEIANSREAAATAKVEAESAAERVETDAGSQQALFNVQLSRPATTDLSFDFRTLDGSATGIAESVTPAVRAAGQRAIRGGIQAIADYYQFTPPTR